MIDFNKIFASIEEALYDALMLLVLFPVTLVRNLWPAWSIRYLDKQFALDEKERFKDNLSPVFLFTLIIIGIIPLYQFSAAHPEIIPAVDMSTKAAVYITSHKDLDYVQKIFYLSVLFNINNIGYTVVTLLALRQRVDRNTSVGLITTLPTSLACKFVPSW